MEIDKLSAMALNDNKKLKLILKANTEIKDNSSSLFSLISKIRAQEIEPIDPAILIKDLELPEGSYEVKSGSTSITTDFVKTDDKSIIHCELCILNRES